MDWENLIDENGCAVIPDGVTEIEDLAFFECGDLTGVMIPRSVTNIGISAFAGCTALASIDVSPDNPEYKSEGNCCLSKDGKTLVFGCRTSVIPDGVKIIGEGAFFKCTGLLHIEIPDGVKVICENAFEGCTGLTDVKVPDSVIEVGPTSFRGCGLVNISGPFDETFRRFVLKQQHSFN